MPDVPFEYFLDDSVPGWEKYKALNSDSYYGFNVIDTLQRQWQGPFGIPTWGGTRLSFGGFDYARFFEMQQSGLIYFAGRIELPEPTALSLLALPLALAWRRKAIPRGE